uniref:Secreted protein n=1 Tax=Globodera pallida TaxID=36090 RepID=A0A183CKF5_GLOPA
MTVFALIPLQLMFIVVAGVLVIITQCCGCNKKQAEQPPPVKPAADQQDTTSESLSRKPVPATANVTRKGPPEAFDLDGISKIGPTSSSAVDKSVASIKSSTTSAAGMSAASIKSPTTSAERDEDICSDLTPIYDRCSRE